jgi:hypothetical protein
MAWPEIAAGPNEQQEATRRSLSAVAVLAQELAVPELALTHACVVVDVVRVYVSRRSLGAGSLALADLNFLAAAGVARRECATKEQLLDDHRELVLWLLQIEHVRPRRSLHDPGSLVSAPGLARTSP